MEELKSEPSLQVVTAQALFTSPGWEHQPGDLSLAPQELNGAEKEAQVPTAGQGQKGSPPIHPPAVRRMPPATGKRSSSFQQPISVRFWSLKVDGSGPPMDSAGGNWPQQQGDRKGSDPGLLRGTTHSGTWRVT